MQNEQKYTKARLSTLLRVGGRGGGRGLWSAFILLLDRAEIQTWTLLIICAELPKSWRFSSSYGQYHPRGFLIFLRALPACPRRSLERKQKVCEHEIRKRKRPILSCWKYCKTQDNILLNNAAAASSSTAVQFFRFSFVCRIFFSEIPRPLYPWRQRLTMGDEKFLTCPQESIETPMTGNGKLISTSFKT